MRVAARVSMGAGGVSAVSVIACGVVVVVVMCVGGLEPPSRLERRQPRAEA